MVLLFPIYRRLYRKASRLKLSQYFSVRFSNITAGAVTVKAWAVPSGGSAVDSTVCLPSTSISANAYIDVDIPVLSAGGTFRAQAGAASSVTVANLDGFLQS